MGGDLEEELVVRIEVSGGLVKVFLGQVHLFVCFELRRA